MRVAKVECGGVTRAAKGADCKSPRTTNPLNTSSEKLLSFGALSVNRLAAISECASGGVLYKDKRIHCTDHNNHRLSSQLGEMAVRQRSRPGQLMPSTTSVWATDMKRIFIPVISICIATGAFAQQRPDPALLQKIIGSMQAQRNQAMDAAAIAEARGAGLADDLAKAQARIKELEPKPEANKKDQ
jgi:hypothetical protein